LVCVYFFVFFVVSFVFFFVRCHFLLAQKNALLALS